MMGALSELYDAELSRTAYRIADGIYNDEIEYFELGREYVTLTEIKDYLTDHRDTFLERNADILAPMIYDKLQQMLGHASPPRFFFLSEWHFKVHKSASGQIIHRCQKFGLEFDWRISTDDDFFMFRPLKHGIGLEIRNVPNYPPYRLNQIFGKIVTDEGPIQFRW